MKPKILTEFDLLTLKFYHERELTLWTMAIRSDTLASFEQKMPSKVEIGVVALRLLYLQCFDAAGWVAGKASGL